MDLALGGMHRVVYREEASLRCGHRTVDADFGFLGLPAQLPVTAPLRGQPLKTEGRLHPFTELRQEESCFARMSICRARLESKTVWPSIATRKAPRFRRILAYRSAFSRCQKRESTWKLPLVSISPTGIKESTTVAAFSVLDLEPCVPSLHRRNF